MVKVGIGQDSHRFESEKSAKPLVLGGIHIPEHRGCMGNSDADVVLHALCNAISGISSVNILGAYTDKLCLAQGITDSKIYVRHALATLRNYTLSHLSISIECKTPRLAEHIESMKQSIGLLLNIGSSDIGITATSGEGLTEFGRGEGIQAFVIATATKIS